MATNGTENQMYELIRGISNGQEWTSKIGSKWERITDPPTWDHEVDF